MTQRDMSTLFAAAVLSLGASAAWANPITINPYASNTGGTGNGTGGNYRLEGATNYGDTTITGGGATGFERVYTGTNNNGTGSFSAEMVFDITSLSGITGSLGLGSTWQLFALVTVTGTGTWSSTPENGKTPGFVAASGATVNLQIYGVNGTGDSFKDPTINTSGTPPAAPSVTPLTQGVSIGHDPLTAGSTTDPDHYNLATSNQSHVGTHACWDGTAIGGSSNCILLADGTNSTISLMIGGQTATGDTEEFSIDTLLSPEAYALGAGGTGFWGGDTNLELTINSGGGTTESWVSVDDNTCTSNPVVCQFETNNNGLAANWDVQTQTSQQGNDLPVPEPGSLVLFGTALMGVVFRLRRHR
jgi:hypothetical protein